jgi:hypothetical protein
MSSSVHPSGSLAVQCRLITPADIGAVADLLKKGFGSQRSHRFWLRMLERLGKYAAPAGMPKYGYLLEHAGRPVGVLLLISSIVNTGSARSIRCNGSGWFVEPEFRPYGSLLAPPKKKPKPERQMMPCGTGPVKRFQVERLIRMPSDPDATVQISRSS